LETIRKLEPEKEKKPLSDLAAQPFEEFVSFREKQDEESILRRWRISERLKEQSGELSYFSLFDKDDPLRNAIWQWGEKYHLNSDWCYDIALKSLQSWHQFKESLGERFVTLPFYGHPDYLGFGSLAMVHRLSSMPRDSLSEQQKSLVDSFSGQLVSSFNERERAFLSYYAHDPHSMDDELFFNRVQHLIEAGLLSVNSTLPVLNLLNRSDLDKLRNILLERAKNLLERVKETAKRISSVVPREVGADEVSKHIEWAVRYQVFDERYYSIEACKSGYPRDKKSAAVNVRRQALRMLSRVDLTPRPATIGRSRVS